MMFITSEYIKFYFKFQRRSTQKYVFMQKYASMQKYKSHKKHSTPGKIYNEIKHNCCVDTLNESIEHKESCYK